MGALRVSAPRPATRPCLALGYLVVSNVHLLRGYVLSYVFSHSNMVVRVAVTGGLNFGPIATSMARVPVERIKPFLTLRYATSLVGKAVLVHSGQFSSVVIIAITRALIYFDKKCSGRW